MAMERDTLPNTAPRSLESTTGKSETTSQSMESIRSDNVVFDACQREVFVLRCLLGRKIDGE